MVATSALSLSPAYKASYINFLWKGPLTVKVRKKSSVRFWATSVFVLKYVHI